MKRLTLLFFTVFSACFVMQPLSDNASYELEDASVRLIVRHPDDSLRRTDYDVRYGFRGQYYPKLETVDRLDTTRRSGIAIRLWTRTVMNGPGVFYGPYARNGLLYKIGEVKISFTGTAESKEITGALRGDSTISAYLWRSYARKRLPQATYMDGRGFINPYFSNIESWVETLNHKPATLEELSHYDYIFWLDKTLAHTPGFKPEALTLQLTLVDSSGALYKELRDTFVLNTH